MYSDTSVLTNCPDWYSAEKETCKTIKMLTNMKELTFYLKNPDGYVRRLAILRINELKLKESLESLRELLDDPFESDINKNLSAWTIKSISYKWNIELFITNRLLSKYSGTEMLNDIYMIKTDDELSELSLEANITLMEPELSIENNILWHSEDMNFDTSFPINEWIAELTESLKDNFTRFVLGLPLRLLSSVKGLPAALFFKVPSLLKQFIMNASRTRALKSNTHRKHDSFYNASAKRQFNPVLMLKKVIFICLYAFFTPVRFIIRYKKIAGLLVVFLYCLLVFTTPGKTLAYQYTGLDLVEVQSSAYSAAKEVISYAWSEMKSIFGIESETELPMYESPDKTVEGLQADTLPGSIKRYRVTAKTGLNIRTGPESSAPKAGFKTLAYNSIVSYLSKSQKDANGGLWYYIEAPDGQRGWVYSKWLEESGGVSNAGK